jgi:hypothetical protein
MYKVFSIDKSELFIVDQTNHSKKNRTTPRKTMSKKYYYFLNKLPSELDERRHQI